MKHAYFLVKFFAYIAKSLYISYREAILGLHS